MKHSLADFPHCCLDGPHYCEVDAYLAGMRAELENQPTRFKCFHCGEWFQGYEATRCPDCAWLKCPHCNLCLCQLGDEAKRVALAMWDGHVSNLNEILGLKAAGEAHDP